MKREEIRDLLKEYYAAFNAKDEARILAVFHEDCEFLDLTMDRHLKGMEQLSGFIRETWRRSPYFRVEPETIFVRRQNICH